MAEVKEELEYTKSHEWIEKNGDIYTIGLTDFAQDSLGDIVFVNLPEEGDDVTAGEPFADIESVKAVSDVFSPVTGIVAAVNEELADSPELVNEDPYGSWLIKVEEVSDIEELLDAKAYEEHCANEEA
ncbi:glycine cleavage system protein GcvH [Atopobium sp. oral taxon 810]|uniref:glycine cleavage system protein GcvH n=1 Tax=Atopobium sp. oral taxon 810 TaxID=712158 RepID=UPI0003962A76|nr:glycine cleavage system protein GcvH [Atopobium sp. oral taxon 810]ERI06061.1 glycine cleavage system H protein [Atopobium sp. oral taxon 810 str. F0209]